jgi:hypothetical protein
MVICEMCRTVRAQSLLVITSRKSSINPITNPNTVYSHSKIVAIGNLVLSLNLDCKKPFSVRTKFIVTPQLDEHLFITISRNWISW